MKIVFMGTPDFAVPSLKALVSAGHEISAVLCQPDKPAGRGMKLTPPPVKVAALELNLPVLQPIKLREPSVFEQLVAMKPDLFVVAAYGKILARNLLDLPRLGAINVHASLLPRLRGAAPLNWAVIRGEKSSGVTIMRMSEGMDEGDMLLWAEVPLAPRETTGSLHDRLMVTGAELLIRAVAQLEQGTLESTPQDHSQATYAPKLTSDLGRIDWTQPATIVDQLVRGVTPFPGAFTFLEGKRVRVLATNAPESGSGTPGTLLAADPQGLLIACGEGSLRVTMVQPEGRKAQTAREFLSGHRLAPGVCFSAQAEGPANAHQSGERR